MASLRAQLARLGGAADNPDGIILPKGQMSEAGLEYIRRVRDVKYYETIFEVLARQFELAKLDEAREGVTIQVVDAAIPPDKRSFPKRTEIVMAATAVGLLLGFFSAFMLSIVQRWKGDPRTAAKLKFLRKSLSRRGQHANAI